MRAGIWLTNRLGPSPGDGKFGEAVIKPVGRGAIAAGSGILKANSFTTEKMVAGLSLVGQALPAFHLYFRMQFVSVDYVLDRQAMPALQIKCADG